jgi:glycosyltransferase involved in cell wall biosynthesis
VISILLATTGRPEMAERCVRSIKDTTEGHDVEIVAAVDACGDTLWRLHELGCVLDWDSEYRGCSQAWNDALSLSKGDLLVLAGDDLVFQPGWLGAALSTLDEFEDGWGMVGFNDGNFDGHNPFSTHYLMSRRLVVEVFGGVVAWPHYRHSFNDVEACERAKRAGRYAWCEDAHVRHEHWLFGARPQDQTDTRNLSGHAASERTYRERAMAGFPNDFDPVITC